MNKTSRPNVAVVVPNWNGHEDLPACLDSLLAQSLPAHLIVVDNGSNDVSIQLLESRYPGVELIRHSRNKGFAGGVNAGFRRAITMGVDYVAAFNNDAVADKNWLEELVDCLKSNKKAGIATCKFVTMDKKLLDSTGDYYTTWGLPYPRGRGEPLSDKYDKQTIICGASGGATLYRVAMLEDIGLFDEDYFAYYEDVDLSLRAQLREWKVAFVPSSIAYHQIGATSSRIKGFTTYQTMKNLPILLWKNVPRKLLPMMLPRFALAYTAFFLRAFQRRVGWYAIKGELHMLWLLPKKTLERWHIQKKRKISDAFFSSFLTYDLPPNATKLRTLRARWHKIRGRS